MQPIITSRLDNDFYAFTMGQLIWKYFKDVKVKYKFFNRGTKLDPSLLSKLEEQIALTWNTYFSEDEINYLRSLGIFSNEYLNWLAKAAFPLVDCWVEDGSIQIEYEGYWASAVFWETPLLSIITELFMKSLGDISLNYVMDKFFVKSFLLTGCHDLKIMEFGSRRRASKGVQESVLRAMQKYNAKNLIGTSNVMFAKELGLKPMGTMAHQLFMVITALLKAGAPADNWLEDGTKLTLSKFEQMYGNHPEMLIYLPDTYGTRTGLSLMPLEQAQRWAGIRQDSGTPHRMVFSILDWYENHNIDPRDKLIVPSDGLSISDSISLYNMFHGLCKLAFGVGTSLTNDVGVPAPNFVIKPVSANGQPCIKLSDSQGKVTGNSQLVEEYRAAALDLQKGSL